VLAIWRPYAEQQLELVGLRLEYCHTRLADGAEADWIAARLERACSRLGTAVARTAEQRFTLTPIREQEPFRSTAGAVTAPWVPARPDRRARRTGARSTRP